MPAARAVLPAPCRLLCCGTPAVALLLQLCHYTAATAIDCPLLTAACLLCPSPLRACLQRDGCPKIINLGSAKTDLFYERKKYSFKKN